MAIPKKPNDKERTVGRRKEDWRIRDLNHHYRQLFNVVQVLTSEMNMETLFQVIIDQTNKIMGCERSTVFLYDGKARELWSFVATGLKKNEIRVPIDDSVAGSVFQTRTPLCINDVYSDSRFFPEVDKRTGYRTRNLFCVPIINRHKVCVGALEALNKVGGDFAEEDRALLVSVSYYVAIALENSRLYEELKALDKAKERIINHLSHELRTPLSIISGALGRISRELEKEQISRLNQTIERGQRNVLRLQDLQIKIADIVNRKPHEESGTIIGIIEDALNLVEELREEDFRDGVELVLERLSARLNDVYGPKEACVEKIDLEMLLDEVYQEALLAMKERQLVIIPDFEKGLFLEMDKDIVKKICAGLLRNAIENTPDEGRIEIGSRSKNGFIEIDFRDYGVGVTTENQNLIFGGFFHTQETDYYASKRPYAFSAGGTGSDLLRTKIFSERYGFSVDFETSRCNHLPEDKDACPGRISACSFIKDKSECLSSGGSVFSLRFPME